eukprot:RCo043317
MLALTSATPSILRNVLNAGTNGVYNKIRLSNTGGCHWKPTYEALRGSDTVLIKPMLYDLQENHVAAVLQELQLLVHFRGHPNIVSIVDLVLCLDGAVVVTEIPGQALERLFASGFEFSEELVVSLMYQLLFALLSIHRAGVTHGNISPSTLVIGPRGDLKVSEFGMSRATALPEYSNADPGRRCRAPELLLELAALVGPAADMWAFGVILGRFYNCRRIPGHRLEYRPLCDGEGVLRLFQSMIAIAGTPTAEDIAALPADIQEHVRSLPEAAPLVLENLPGLPSSPPSEECCAVMRGVLRFHPRHRLTAAEAMRMPYFGSIASAGDTEIAAEAFPYPRSLSAATVPPRPVEEMKQEIADLLRNLNGIMTEEKDAAAAES